MDRMREAEESLMYDPANSGTLPASAYFNEEFFEREKDDVFCNSWLYAGSLQNLREPGDYITSEILSQSVFIIRGRDGELRGFHNVCQHRACQLLSDYGNTKVITCPYHAWSYQLDGKLRSARGTDAMAFDKENYHLKPVRIEVFADHFIFYNLDSTAAPLAEQAGDMADHMRRNILDFEIFEFQGALVMPRELEANWKVAVDNYLECFHCGPTHPSFLELFDMKLTTELHRHWTVQSCGVGSRSNSAFHIGAEEKNDRAFFYWLFPNTCFTVIPGDPSHVMVQIFQPIATNRTNGRTDMYAPLGSKPNVGRNKWLATVTGPEDRAVCESVQRGLQSKGFGAGRFIYDPKGGEVTEECVYKFQRMVAERVPPGNSARSL